MYQPTPRQGQLLDHGPPQDNFTSSRAAKRKKTIINQIKIIKTRINIFKYYLQVKSINR